MAYDLNEIKFGGAANTVAMEDYAASFDQEPSDSPLRNALWSEYQQAGSPKNQKKWLRERLSTLFPCVGPRPQWIEGSPVWPFLEDRPMTFITQYAIPVTPVSEAMQSADTVIYVFGGRVPVPECNGWRMEYRVVTQYYGMPGGKARPAGTG